MTAFFWGDRTGEHTPRIYEVVRRKGAGKNWNEYQLPSLF